MEKGNKATKRFVAKKKEAPVLSDGRHLLKVIGAVETNADNKEKTEQVEVTLQDEKGIVQMYWLSLEGYKKDGDDYVLGKDGLRIRDEGNTEIAEDIFLGFAVDCGIDDGEGFDIEDLVDCEVGVNIYTNSNGYKRVQYSFPAEEVGEESLF